MRAGQLQHRLEFEIPADASIDASGTPVRVWAPIGSFYGEIIEESATELTQPQGASDESTVVFRTRYWPAVAVGGRIIHRGTPHLIRGVKIIGRNRGLEIRTVMKTGAA